MILLVGGLKGGTGKTTLATNLAAMRAISGRDVLLIDADKQGSSALWSEVRDDADHAPRIPCVQKRGKGIAKEIADMAGRYSDVVIDAGGRDAPELRASMLAADVLLIPVLPSQYDVWALEDADEMVSAAMAINPDLRALAVMNRVNPNPAMKEAVEAEEFISSLDNMTLAPAVIRDRVVFRRSAMDGQAVTEAKPADKKAIAEIEALYRGVFNDGV